MNELDILRAWAQHEQDRAGALLGENEKLHIRLAQANAKYNQVLHDARQVVAELETYATRGELQRRMLTDIVRRIDGGMYPIEIDWSMPTVNKL